MSETPTPPETYRAAGEWLDKHDREPGALGLAFHRDSFMMAACACGFTINSFGREHARASYRLHSHERRCEVARRIQDAFDRVAQRAINEARHD